MTTFIRILPNTAVQDMNHGKVGIKGIRWLIKIESWFANLIANQKVNIVSQCCNKQCKLSVYNVRLNREKHTREILHYLFIIKNWFPVPRLPGVRIPPSALINTEIARIAVCRPCYFFVQKQFANLG
jgi:hypothetical protein